VSNKKFIQLVPKFKMGQLVWLANGSSGRVSEITIREDTILYRLNNIHSEMKLEYQVFSDKDEYLNFHASQFKESNDE
jgi:hypothetical protein